LKVPEGLLEDSPLATSFGNFLSMCGSLEEVPVSLFDNQRLVTSFDTVFNGCGKMTGESPYTIINGNKVHLYERCDYPDYFVTPASYRSCFSSGSKLTDWSSIPTSWR
jgi:hypothetical protein